MKTILVIGNCAHSIYNFRAEFIRLLSKSGYKVHVAVPDSDEIFENFCSENDLTCHFFPLQRTGMNPVKDRNSYNSLRKIIRDIQPNSVFSYTIKAVIYGSLAAKAEGVKNIYSMITGLGYTFITESVKGKIIRKAVCSLYRRALRHNRITFFQNPDDRDLFTDYKLVKTSHTMIINGSGVDTSHFSVETLPAQPNFLLIARLLRDKGIYEYAEAARSIRDKYPQAKFTLVGPLDSNPSCINKNDLSAWVADGTIEYLGALDDVRPAIRDCSVYVLPSYREGTPRTVLESMAMGRPIITTDAPGCRETVIDDQTGFLVPVKNVNALTEAIERFIQDEALSEKMGLESRKLCEEKYDVHKVNQSILNGMGHNN